MIVSIVIPVYNRRDYIDKCIRSIVNQSYKYLEIILVDDGSTDGSAELLDNYAGKDSRIIVIHKMNGGLSDARNAGIDAASGEYLCFVDADDYVNSHYVEYMLSTCIEYNCDMTICSFRDVYPFDTFEFNSKQRYSVVIETNVEALGDIYSPKNVETIVAWNKLYKRSLFEEIRYPVGRIHEDEYTTPMLIYNSNKVARIDAELYFYLHNDTGITGSQYSLARLDILWALEGRMDFFRLKNLMELYYNDLYKYLQKILVCYYMISKSSFCDRSIKKDLMDKYKNAYAEVSKAGWSIKRKAALRFFGGFPRFYFPIRYLRQRE